jgi:TP901 family phage tail tape measure protein
MADLDLAIKILLEGADHTQAAVRSAIGGLDDLNSRVETLAAPLAAASSGILAMDTALAALGVALGTVAFNESVKFESALIDLDKVLSDTDRPVNDLADDIKQLALRYGESSADLLRSAANFKQSGFDTEESLKLVKDALDLVIAGDLEAAEASELLVSGLKGFKAPASEAAHFIEVVNAASNAYATNVKELATGMAGISPIAKTMGLSFEESADLLVPIIEVFRSGSEASDALKTGLLRLVDPPKEAREAIEALGVKLEDQNGKLRTGKDIVLDVAQAFVKLDESERLVFASTVFGVDQSAKLVEAFTALGTKSVDVAAKMGTVPSVAEEVEKRLAATERTIARAGVAFQELAITVGNEFRPQLAGVIGAAGEFGAALDKAVGSGAFDEFFAALGPKLGAIEDTVRAMARNLPAALAGVDFGPLLDSFGALGAEVRAVFEAFFGEIDLRTVEGLQAALQQTADAFAALVNVTAGITEAFRPFFAALGEAIRNTSELGGAAQRDLGQVLGIAQQIITFGTGLAAVFAVIGQAGIDMARVIDGAFAGVRVGINALQVGFDTVALGVNEILRKTNDALGEVIGDIASTFERLSAEPIIGDLFKGIAEGARALATDFAKSADDLQLRSDAIASNLDRNLSEMKTAQEGFTGALAGTNEKYTEAGQRLQTLRSNAEGIAASFGQQADAAAKSSRSTADLNAEMLRLAESGGRAELVGGEVVVTMGNLGSAAGKAAGALVPMAQAQQHAMDSARGFRLEIIDGIPTYTQYGNTLSGVRDATDKTAAGMKEAEKASESFRLKILEIASDERIKLIEAKVDLDIANLEADTRRVEAAFATIDTTIQSTGEVIGTALEGLGAFADKAFLRGAEREVFNALQDQIKAENELRERSVTMQERLTQATVENLRARSEALARGDALIKIDTTGVEPALQLVLETIIKEAQIVSNSQGLELLIGLPSA